MSQIVKTLDGSDFAKPTRCPAWNVKELLGHLFRDVDRINAALESDAPAEPTHDSVAYFRSYDPTPGGAAAKGVAERSKEVAARYPTGQALADDWDELWPRTLDRAAAADPGRVVVTIGPALTLEEYLKTRVLEVTVHRMDLEDALGRRGWGTDTAVSIVDDILVGLLGAEPPRALDWDVVDFIETGTGRRALRDDERKTLGVRLAKRFPLLG